MYWITQVPGAILARKYGTKKIFGVAIFASSLLCFLIPASAYIGHGFLIGVRALQGLISVRIELGRHQLRIKLIYNLQGLSGPAVVAMIARWVPPDERSKFLTVFHGSSVGVAVGYPLFGIIISISSWEWIFYTSGLIGFIWCGFWHYFVHDSPAAHPRISSEELEHIQTCLDGLYHEETSVCGYLKF